MKPVFLLEILSRDHGRVGLVARGARTGKSRWKNLLQPFRPLLVGWSQRGELGTLTGAEEVATLPPPAGEALICGLYANELLVRFLHRSDPHPEVFEHYQRLLSILSSGERVQPGLRIFEKDLLQSVGLGLQLEHEYDGQNEISNDAWYEYHPESGPIRREPDQKSDTPLVSGRALICPEYWSD